MKTSLPFVVTTSNSMHENTDSSDKYSDKIILTANNNKANLIKWTLGQSHAHHKSF